MKHLFIPYELAKLAKEKGFNEPCIAYYDRNHKGILVGNMWNGNIIEAGLPIPHETQLDVFAPLYQQIVDWFQNKHNLFIEIRHSWMSDGIHYVWINDKQIRIGAKALNYNSYYEALNKAIEEAFKLITK